MSSSPFPFGSDPAPWLAFLRPPYFFQNPDASVPDSEASSHGSCRDSWTACLRSLFRKALGVVLFVLLLIPALLAGLVFAAYRSVQAQSRFTRESAGAQQPTLENSSSSGPVSPSNTPRTPTSVSDAVAAGRPLNRSRSTEQLSGNAL